MDDSRQRTYAGKNSRSHTDNYCVVIFIIVFSVWLKEIISVYPFENENIFDIVNSEESNASIEFLEENFCQLNDNKSDYYDEIKLMKLFDASSTVGLLKPILTWLLIIKAIALVLFSLRFNMRIFKIYIRLSIIAQVYNICIRIEEWSSIPSIEFLWKRSLIITISLGLSPIFIYVVGFKCCAQIDVKKKAINSFLVGLFLWEITLIVFILSVKSLIVVHRNNGPFFLLLLSSVYLINFIYYLARAIFYAVSSTWIQTKDKSSFNFWKCVRMVIRYHLGTVSFVSTFLLPISLTNFWLRQARFRATQSYLRRFFNCILAILVMSHGANFPLVYTVLQNKNYIEASKNTIRLSTKYPSLSVLLMSVHSFLHSWQFIVPMLIFVTESFICSQPTFEFIKLKFMCYWFYMITAYVLISMPLSNILVTFVSQSDVINTCDIFDRYIQNFDIKNLVRYSLHKLF